MDMQNIAVAFALFLLASGTPAYSEDAPTGTSTTTNDSGWVADAATIARNRAIVAGTKGAGGAFVVKDDGAVQHVQSGLICPAKFPNVSFWHAEIFTSSFGTGMDVGCDYGRNGPSGDAISKLTIFAARAPNRITLDQAFDHYREEIRQTSPNAVPQGEALNVERDKSDSFPEFRSEQYVEALNGTKFTSQLLVTVSMGWIFEIRTTFQGEGNRIDVQKGEAPDAAAQAMGDRLMLAAAYARVAASTGK